MPEFYTAEERRLIEAGYGVVPRSSDPHFRFENLPADVQEEIRRGVEDARAGRVVPWSQAKRELGIDG